MTCISRLESIELADLDADRYGLIVRSRTHPWQIGAALPNTPDRESEAQQYRECLRKAGIRAQAPHDLYRFSVIKQVQAGQTWQPYGVPAPREAIAPDFVEYLRDLTHETVEGGGPRSHETVEGGGPAPTSDPPPSQPWETHGVGVTVYRDGDAARYPRQPGQLIAGRAGRAAAGAWAAAGLEAGPPARREQCQIVVTVLHHRYRLGSRTADAASGWFRPSAHAVMAATDEGSSTVLPHIACHHGWDASKVAQLALGKADPAGAGGSAEWTSYQASSWLMTASGARELRAGFVTRPEGSLDVKELAIRIADYILAEALANDGLPAYARQPVLDVTTQGGTAGRVLLALTALAEAGPLLDRDDYTAAAGRGARRVVDGIRREAGSDLELVLPDLQSGATAECHALLLLARTAAPARCDELAPLAEPVAGDLFAKVSTLFRADGMITRLPAGLRLQTDHEVLPGLAVAAVVAYAQALQDAVLPESLDRQLDWYRRRFEKVPSWLAAGWLMQGWASAWLATEDPRYAEFVLTVADWTCARQFHINGAFLTDPHRRTGCFNTGYLAEGIAAALTVSRALGDREREAKLGRSLCRALRFVAALMIRSEDLYCMPTGEFVVGAVRDSPVNPSLRIDQSAHALRALLGAIRNDLHAI